MKKTIATKLKPYHEGLGLLALGIIVFFIVRGNPFRELQLLKASQSAQGIVIEVNDFEDREDNGNITQYFFVKYEFTTPDGNKISDLVEISGKAESRGYSAGQSIEILYLPGAPEVHRIRELQSSTMAEWIMKYILFGILVAIAPGCYFLLKAYQSERKHVLKKAA